MSKKMTRRCLARCQSRPKQSASAVHRCARGKLLDVMGANFQNETRRDLSELKISKIFATKDALPVFVLEVNIGAILRNTIKIL